MKPKDLSPREGKCLRHVVMTSQKPVLPAKLVSHIDWSDLPHNLLQSKATLETLRGHGLVERKPDGYWPTEAGNMLIKAANKEKAWNS